MNLTKTIISDLVRVVNILFVVFMLFPIPSSLQKLNINSCIDFVPSTYTIRVACGSATLTDIYTMVNGPLWQITKLGDVLIKESANGDWLLKANLEIRTGSSFTIDSTDTKWLKIYSDGTTAYNIKIYGNMKIDSVKITSWNPITNDYPSVEDSKPRAYITVYKETTGTTDIFNSELGYLG
jgi:mannuronan 5-epimerase